MSSVESVTSISRSNTTTSTVSNTQVDNTVDRTPVDNSVAAVFRGEEVIDTSTADERSAIGHLSKSSLNGADLGLDWALIELLNQSVYKAQHDKGLAGIGTGLSVPRWLSSNPTTSISVSAATGFSGCISGVLLPGSTMMRLTPRGKFQEVWSVQFHKPLGKIYLVSYIIVAKRLKFIQLQEILVRGLLTLRAQVSTTDTSLLGLLVDK
jgi:hypothetical protein